MYFVRDLGFGHSFPVAARSASTIDWFWRIRPAGIDASPLHSRASIWAFSLPVTSHKMNLERLMSGYVNVIRRLDW
jgi:hypothetical protein